MLARTAEATNGEDVLATPSSEAVPARASAFGRALRHSRRVRFLKLALPLLAVAIAIAFPVYSYLAAPASTPVKAEGSVFSDGKLVMANPKLEGVTGRNLPYSMTAVRAIQEVSKESVIALEDIKAKLPIDAGNVATIDAAHGVYNRDDNTLDLDEEISVTTTSGVAVKLKSAFLDISKGNMKTDDPVDIRRAGARITADSMTVQDNGKVVIFEKRVRVNIDPAAMKATNEKESGDAAQ